MTRQFTSPSGFLVYVGRNAKENEHISTVLIDADDYWFHARDAPGAHVLLKTGSLPVGNKGITRQDFGFCKQLALQYSKGKGGVHQARGHQVSKNIGDTLGTVVVISQAPKYLETP